MIMKIYCEIENAVLTILRVPCAVHTSSCLWVMWKMLKANISPTLKLFVCSDLCRWTYYTYFSRSHLLFSVVKVGLHFICFSRNCQIFFQLRRWFMIPTFVLKSWLLWVTTDLLTSSRKYYTFVFIATHCNTYERVKKQDMVSGEPVTRNGDHGFQTDDVIINILTNIDRLSHKTGRVATECDLESTITRAAARCSLARVQRAHSCHGPHTHHQRHHTPQLSTNRRMFFYG